MNLQERLIEKGYHPHTAGDEMTIYLHGNFIIRLYRTDKRDDWKTLLGDKINLFNVGQL